MGRGIRQFFPSKLFLCLEWLLQKNPTFLITSRVRVGRLTEITGEILCISKKQKYTFVSFYLIQMRQTLVLKIYSIEQFSYLMKEQLFYLMIIKTVAFMFNAVRRWKTAPQLCCDYNHTVVFSVGGLKKTCLFSGESHSFILAKPNEG